MIVLGITTSSARGGAAIFDTAAGLLGEAVYEAGDRHAENLFATLDEALRRAQVGRGAIDRLACDVGPGSFTGVRAASAALQAIGLALDRPTVPVLSLEAMAFAARATAPVLAVLDARKSEAFIAVYAPDCAEVRAPSHVPLSDGPMVAARVVELGAIVVGAFASTLLPNATVLRGEATDFPSAAAIAEMGAMRAPSALMPTYVRAPDAKTEAERAALRAERGGVW